MRAFRSVSCIQRESKRLFSQAKKTKWKTMDDIKKELEEKAKFNELLKAERIARDKGKKAERNGSENRSNRPKVTESTVSVSAKMTDVVSDADSQANIRRMGYRYLTSIQQQSYQSIKAKKSVIMCAPDGTGKTFAYLLPLFQELSEHSSPPKGSVLIICPTRDAADSASLMMYRLFARSKLRAGIAVQPPAKNSPKLAENGDGSANLHVASLVRTSAALDLEDEELRRGAHVVIGTASRIEDLLSRGVLLPSDVRTIVVDDLLATASLPVSVANNEVAAAKRIVRACSAKDRRLAEIAKSVSPSSPPSSSSTPSLQVIISSGKSLLQGWSKEQALELATAGLEGKEVVSLDLCSSQELLQSAKGMAHLVHREASSVLMHRARVLASLSEVPPPELAAAMGEGGAVTPQTASYLVFCHDSVEADLLASHPLLKRTSTVLHDKLEPSQRAANLHAFRTGRSRYLLATDSSLQGVDLYAPDQIEILNLTGGDLSKRKQALKHVLSTHVIHPSTNPPVVVQVAPAHSAEVFLARAARAAVKAAPSPSDENLPSPPPPSSSAETPADDLPPPVKRQEGVVITFVYGETEHRFERVMRATQSIMQHDPIPMSVPDETAVRNHSALSLGEDLMAQSDAAFWSTFATEEDPNTASKSGQLGLRIDPDTGKVVYEENIFSRVATSTVETTPDEAERLLAAALHLLSDKLRDATKTWVSPLSGRPGFAVIMLHDPHLQRLRTRAHALGFLKLALKEQQALIAQVGRVALTSAGWVCELPVDLARQVVHSPVSRDADFLVTITHNVPPVIADELRTKISAAARKKELQAQKTAGLFTPSWKKLKISKNARRMVNAAERKRERLAAEDLEFEEALLSTEQRRKNREQRREKARQEAERRAQKSV